MRSMARQCQLLAISMGLAFAAGSARPGDEFVAGVRAHQRPAHAPVVTQVVKDPQWYRQALHGVEPPYPASLQFLEDQGAWHTPFTRPGMTGVYDLRGWHRPAPVTR